MGGRWRARARRRLPGLFWLAKYDARDLPADLLAGALGTLSTVPEVMAYAVLAGLPANAGLYSLLLPLAAYTLLGTSREMSLAPTATLTALLAGTVAPLAGADEARHFALCVLMSWLLGCVLLAAGILRLGYVANLVTSPVLRGYFAGAALVIAAGQVAELLGAGTHGVTLPSIVEAIVRADTWTTTPLLLGLGLVALMYLLHALGLRHFGPAAAVIAGVGVVRALSLDVPVIGRLEPGLPPFQLPTVHAGELRSLSGGLLAIALLIFLDSAGIARRYADQKGYPIDPDQELRALGVANLAAGATSAMPVSGNLGDTILLGQAGARTPMVGVVTLALVLLVLQFGASLPNLPLAAFAAIIIYAVLRPPDLQSVRRIRQFDAAEFWLGMLCLLGVVLLGLMKGLLLAIAVTVLVLLARASRPHVREIGYVPGAQPSIVDRAADPHACDVPDALVLQPIGALFFASARAVSETARSRFAARPSLPQLVVLDLRVVPWVDFTACEILTSLQEHLRRQGARLLLIRANGYVERQLARAGLAESTAVPGGVQALLALLRLPPDVRDRT